LDTGLHPAVLALLAVGDETQGTRLKWLITPVIIAWFLVISRSRSLHEPVWLFYGSVFGGIFGVSLFALELRGS
jgi:hypothetical protein